MPDYKVHLIFGFVFCAILYYVFRQLILLDIKSTAISLLLIGFAALFPDVDHQNSKIHRWVKSIIIIIAIIVIGVICYPNLKIAFIASFGSGMFLYILLTWFKPKHRGITHTFKFSIIFSIFIGIITLFTFHTLIPALFSFLAYNSHIILDKLVQEL